MSEEKRMKLTVPGCHKTEMITHSPVSESVYNWGGGFIIKTYAKTSFGSETLNEQFSILSDMVIENSKTGDCEGCVCNNDQCKRLPGLIDAVVKNFSGTAWFIDVTKKKIVKVENREEAINIMRKVEKS